MKEQTLKLLEKWNHILTRDGFNMNVSSTKVNETRAATVLVAGPGYRRTGERIDTPKKTNW